MIRARVRFGENAWCRTHRRTTEPSDYSHTTVRPPSQPFSGVVAGDEGVAWGNCPLPQILGSRKILSEFFWSRNAKFEAENPDCW